MHNMMPLMALLHVAVTVSVLTAAVATSYAAAAAVAPRSYYRFEDASNLMKDSAPAAMHLQPKGTALPAAKTQAEGGQVGGWMQLDGSDLNNSLAANASQLPRQCTGLGHYCNPNYGCPNQPGGKVGGCCCNNTNDPQGHLTGMTIEFLIKLGPLAKLRGNLTLFDTGKSAYLGTTWVDLSRHGFAFRMQANRQDAQTSGFAMFLATSNGTGRAATNYLHDGEWHHIVVRRSTGGLTGVGKLDAWIDGQVPQSIDQWFSRPGNPTPTFPWSRETRCGTPAAQHGCGYFGQWTDGVWPSLVILPSPFDGGIDEVALYEVALPDALIVQHYEDAMAHKPYSASVHGDGRSADTAAAPPADPPLEFDLKDFPPGTLLPTPAFTGCGKPHCAEHSTPGVKLSPLAQLQSYPLPRYRPGPVPGHSWSLQKLGNCMNTAYLGGENQANTSVINMPCYISCNKSTHKCNGTTAECVQNATMKIKFELGSRWNYLLALGNFGCNASDPGGTCGWISPTRPSIDTIDMVNANPEMGFEYYLTRQNNHDMQIGTLGGPNSSEYCFKFVSRLVPIPCRVMKKSRLLPSDASESPLKTLH